MKPVALLRLLLVALFAFVMPFSAGAALRKDGTWPAAEKKVSFDFKGAPDEGLERLAREAGWSLVVTKGASAGANDVHVRVTDQPADLVLEALYADAKVVAVRSGSLITIKADSNATPDAPSPPAPSAPSAPSAPEAGSTAPAVPPVPTVRGEDRNVMGGSIVIRKGEVVHTVTVTGGSAKIDGTVTGDLVVMGGSADLREGARVVGNATVFGGSLHVRNGARVDGDVGVIGGALKRDEGAIIGGHIVDDEHSGNVKVNLDDEGKVSTGSVAREVPSTLSERAHAFGVKVTNMALLFVLGCVLLALLTGHMEKMRIEVAARPMKSFAVGLLAAFLGGIGISILLVVLCITVVGIPFAIVIAVLATIAVFGAIATVLTTFGAAVIGHKTQNPYAHLLLGCAAFLVLTSIPYIGGIVAFAVSMIAIGVLFSTKAGGLFDRRPRQLVI